MAKENTYISARDGNRASSQGEPNALEGPLLGLFFQLFGAGVLTQKVSRLKANLL